MKKYLLIIFVLFLNTYVFSQIRDQYVFPYPRIENNTKLAVKCLWGNSITKVDSFNISIDSIGYEIEVLGYYSETPWPGVTLSIDTFDISNYVLADNSYLIKYIACLLYPLNDTVYRVDSASHRILVEASSKVEEIDKDKQIKIYPNPTSGFVTIEADKIEKLEFYNLRGQVLVQSKPNSNKYVLNINNRKKGIYFVKIETEGGVFVEKIIVE